ARHAMPPRPPPSFYQNAILEQYASRPANRVTLRQLTVLGKTLTPPKLLSSANYVRSELPVRLAHRLIAMQHLPFIVGVNPHIERMYQLYWEAFNAFRAVPPIETPDDNRRFCELLQAKMREHLIAIPQLALGISQTADHLPPGEADRFMNETLRSRIGRRVLSEQHVALTRMLEADAAAAAAGTPSTSAGLRGATSSSRIGIVDTRVVAGDTVRYVADVLESHFARILPDRSVRLPEIRVTGRPEITFVYIPEQIQYILYELIKNSIQATLRQHAAHGKPYTTGYDARCGAPATGAGAPLRVTATPARPKALPPIQVTIGTGESKVLFRVSDQGGGIPRGLNEHLWSFAYISKLKGHHFSRVPHLAGKIEE
ncbi:alpha-ketoacid dehydrogenase kinase, partial [Caulochytrium protostelioides]